MKQLEKQVIATIALFALAACGSEGSVGGTKRGAEDPGTTEPGRNAPLAQLNVALSGEAPASASSPHLGVLWTSYLGEEEGIATVTEVVPLPTDLDQLTLSVFQGPPESILREIDGLTIAVGTMVAFADGNGDGTLTIYEDGTMAQEDFLFGYAWNNFVLWVELAPNAELPEGLFVNPEAFTPGLLRVRLMGCELPFEILPMNTPFELTLWDPSVGFGMNPCYDYDQCIEECQVMMDLSYSLCLEEAEQEECDEMLPYLEEYCEFLCEGRD